MHKPSASIGLLHVSFLPQRKGRKYTAEKRENIPNTLCISSVFIPRYSLCGKKIVEDEQPVLGPPEYCATTWPRNQTLYTLLDQFLNSLPPEIFAILSYFYPNFIWNIYP
jgi:hypothetical protein